MGWMDGWRFTLAHCWPGITPASAPKLPQSVTVPATDASGRWRWIGRLPEMVELGIGSHWRAPASHWLTGSWLHCVPFSLMTVTGAQGLPQATFALSDSLRSRSCRGAVSTPIQGEVSLRAALPDCW